MICLQGARQGDGLEMGWHENGKQHEEGTIRDGREVSVKFWNRKGEEVETGEESLK